MPINMELLIVIVLIVLLFATSVTIVQQGSVSVITRFGKYVRCMQAGLNFKIPFIDKVYRKISVQNRSVELQFQAITMDQANVDFKAMLLYAVMDQGEVTIQKVAFKFVDQASFMQALVRTIEGSIRAFVATKKQAEILALRQEIILHVKEQIDNQLDDWGYHLLDLQMNDITFDAVIMQSMAKVVASNNLKAAAENEGQALFITKTKAAEAEGTAIKISAEAERQAAQLRGQGIALFREEVAKGMAIAAKEMETANLEPSFILFSMWTEALKHFAETGKGNTIFLDGTTDNFQRTVRELQATTQANLKG